MTRIPRDHNTADSDLSKAIAALNAERFKLAALFAEKARIANPKDKRILLLLGQALARSGRGKQAVSRLRQAHQLDEGDLKVRAVLATTLDEIGQTEDALRHVNAILAQDPFFIRAITLRGTIYRRLGKSKEAWAWLEPQLPSLPPSPVLALSAAGLLPKDTRPEPILTLLRSCILDQATRPDERRALFYALANALDRAGSHAEAFSAAESASRLIPDRDQNLHHLLLTRMSPSALDSIEPARIDASHAVLICGMPRSGTTLTEQIVAAHPSAATVGESPMLGELTRTLLQHFEEHGLVPTERTTKLAKQYLKHLREDAAPRKKHAQRIIDKMPQNLIHLGVIDKLLPGCKVIRCLRDPRDIALSCYFMDFAARHTYRRTLDSLADEIVLHDLAAKRWKQETSLCIFESHLEQLTGNPEQHTKQLLEFIDLPFDPACLEFHNSTQQVMTASVDQVRSKINTSGQGRWKNYKDQLAPILPRLEKLL